MTPLQEAREELAGLLAGITNHIYPWPVETPALPCLIVSANEADDNGWFVQALKGGEADVALKVRVAVAAVGGNESAYNLLEDLVWQVARAVPVRGSKVQAPMSETLGQTPCYIVDLPVHVHVTE